MMMAMDRNRLIGANGGMPWHISSDFKYFSRTTMGKPMIMGRATYESIGRPLPGRHSIVVTRDKNWRVEGVEVAHSLAQALAAARLHSGTEMMIIGGASLCAQAMPLTRRLYLTVIDHAFEGDTWLDSFNECEWMEVSREDIDETAQGGYRFCYRVLERATDSQPR